MPRGNQGWSTAGRAGRKPLPPGEKRKPRSLKATDAEWEKILEFSRGLKREEKKMKYTVELCNNDDFWVIFETRQDETFRLYIQPKIEDGEVVELTTPDSQDDYILLPRGIDADELIKDMNEEIRKYRGEQ